MGGIGVIIESNLNRVRLSCCWVGVGLGCDNLNSQEVCVQQAIYGKLIIPWETKYQLL